MQTALTIGELEASDTGVETADPVGTVELIQGTAHVQLLNGEVHTLRKGDPVYAGDRIDTAPMSALILLMADGGQLALASHATILLDDEVLARFEVADAAEPMEEETAVSRSSVQEALAALEPDSSVSEPNTNGIPAEDAKEVDPEQLEPTAAGGPKNNEGSSFVILERSAQETQPQSGDIDSQILELALGEDLSVVPNEETLPPNLVAEILLTTPPANNGSGDNDPEAQPLPILS